MIYSTENCKSLYYLHNSLGPQTRVVKSQIKFQAPSPPSNGLAPASSGHPQLLGLRLHSPGDRACPHVHSERKRKFTKACQLELLENDNTYSEKNSCRHTRCGLPNAGVGNLRRAGNAFRSKFKTAHIRISLVRMQNRVKTKLNNNDIFRG